MFQTETKHTVESLSTRVSHGELQKWPLLTGRLYFGASETTYPIFTRQIKTGLCGQETTTRRCPYAQV